MPHLCLSKFLKQSAIEVITTDLDGWIRCVLDADVSASHKNF